MMRKLLFVFGLFLMNKVLITVAAWIAWSSQHLHGSWQRELGFLLVDNFNRWDALLFERIAFHGYTYLSTAFFPLFPTLMKQVSVWTGLSPICVGLVISNVCFLLSMYVFYELLLLDYKPADARKVLVLLAVFPTSYYFSAAYSEGLFMCLSLVSIYAIRKRQWLVAGLAGGLATLTRNTGVLLTIPFVLELFGVTSVSRFVKIRFSREVRYHLLWVCLIPSGLLLYMAYLNVHFHDPLAFSHAEKIWRRQYHNPLWTLFVGLAAYAHYIFHPDFQWHMFGYALTNSLFGIGLIVLLLISYRKMRLSYFVILLYSVVVPLTAPEIGRFAPDYFMSISRFALVIFPLYIAIFEQVGPRKTLYTGTVCIFALTLMIFVYIWTNNMGFIA